MSRLRATKVRRDLVIVNDLTFLVCELHNFHLLNLTGLELELEVWGEPHYIQSPEDFLYLVSTPGDRLTVTCPQGKVERNQEKYLKIYFRTKPPDQGGRGEQLQLDLSEWWTV